MTTRGKVRDDLLPTVTPSVVDVGRAAGFWEGEGSVFLQRGGPVVSATQKDRWILDWMRERFGGRVFKVRTRDIHHWQLCGSQGRYFLMTVYPLLSPRRQAQVRKHFTMESIGEEIGPVLEIPAEDFRDMCLHQHPLGPPGRIITMHPLSEPCELRKNDAPSSG